LFTPEGCSDSQSRSGTDEISRDPCPRRCRCGDQSMHSPVVCAWLLVVLTVASTVASTAAAEPTAGTLRARLLAEGTASLAAAAEAQGDARRGAVAFYQPTMACGRCHLASGKSEGIGPDLTEWKERPATEHLVESILDPSRRPRGTCSKIACHVGVRRAMPGLRSTRARIRESLPAAGPTLQRP